MSNLDEELRKGLQSIMAQEKGSGRPPASKPKGAAPNSSQPFDGKTAGRDGKPSKERQTRPSAPAGGKTDASSSHQRPHSSGPQHERRPPHSGHSGERREERGASRGPDQSRGASEGPRFQQRDNRGRESSGGGAGKFRRPDDRKSGGGSSADAGAGPRKAFGQGQGADTFQRRQNGGRDQRPRHQSSSSSSSSSSGAAASASASASAAADSSALNVKLQAHAQKLGTAAALPAKWKAGGDGAWFDAAAAVLASAAPADGPAGAAGDNKSKPIAGEKRKRKDEGTSKGSSAVGGIVRASPAVVASYREIAERLLNEEVARNEKAKAESSSADTKWLRTVLQSGTSGDRLAALTLLVGESPLHSLRHLDSLLSLAGKKSRREALKAVDAVKDLMLTNLLPDDRKLVSFAARPFDALASMPSVQSSSEALVYWLFEDELKLRYTQFLQALQEHMNDPMVHFKTHALKTVFDLLVGKPEQEAALLTLLVNKLGDPVGKVASKAQFLLSQLVDKHHEAMKPVVIREVRQFLIRPHLSNQAQYFASIFLSQIPLKRGRAHVQLAVDLITTYFQLFELCVQRKQMDSKLLGALLTGINRAFPYATGGAIEGEDGSEDAGVAASAAAKSQEAIESRADTLFAVVHRSNPNTSVQALALLQQVALRRLTIDARGGNNGGGSGEVRPLGVDGFDGNVASAAATTAAASASAAAVEGGDEDASGGSFVDRFYRALYAKLTVEGVQATSKHSILLNLLFRACKHDTNHGRTRAIVKRLVQVALHMPPAFAAGVVLLVGELARAKVDVRAALAVAEQDSAKVRSRQAQGEAAEQAATKKEGADSDSSDSDSDSDDTSSTGSGSEVVPPQPAEKERNLKLLGAMQVDNNDSSKADKVVSFGGNDKDASSSSSSTSYDPLKRDPRYAGAEDSCLWELAPLALHYHPSVRKFADDLLSGAHDIPRDALSPATASGAAASSIPALVSYGGDPLSDFTLMSFLDRFMYKNPKQRFAGLSAAGAEMGEGVAAGAATAAAAAQAQAALESGDFSSLSRAQLEAGYALVQGNLDEKAVEAAAAVVGKGKSAGAAAAAAAAATVAAARTGGAASIMQKSVPRHGRADIDLPANTEAFMQLDPSAVPEEDRFMHTFFRTQATMQAVRDEAAGREGKRGRGAGDADDYDEELGGSRRKLTGIMRAYAAGAHDEPAEEEDEEAAIDAFADKVAEDLLKAAGGGDGPDIDDDESDWSAFGDGDDNESSEDDDGGDDDDEEDDAAEGAKPSSKSKTSANDDAEEDEDDDDDDEDGSFPGDDDDDSEGDDDDDSEPARPSAKRQRKSFDDDDDDEDAGKGGKKKASVAASSFKSGAGTVFADASDFEEELGEEEDRYEQAFASRFENAAAAVQPSFQNQRGSSAVGKKAGGFGNSRKQGGAGGHSGGGGKKPFKRKAEAMRAASGGKGKGGKSGGGKHKHHQKKGGRR